MVSKNNKKLNKKPWKKILYGNFDYPDNYTDKSFLDELKKNINMREVTYIEAFIGASYVTQQICIVTLFLLAYMFLLNNLIKLEYFFIFNLCNLIICYFCFIIRNVKFSKQIQLLLSFILLFLLSPVLKSLTQTISTDTIYACSVFTIIIHLLFNDYAMKTPSSMKILVSNSLSLNSMVFCSICLASRLSSNYHVFLLLLNTVQFFVFYPYVFTLYKFYIQRYIMLGISFVLLYYLVHISVFYMFLLSIILINVICPYLFVKWYSYKHNIYGPWDEATINMNQLNL